MRVSVQKDYVVEPFDTYEAAEEKIAQMCSAKDRMGNIELYIRKSYVSEV